LGTWIFEHGFFLEHGFDGLDTDLSPSAGGFLEHGFDGWDTDLLPSAWIFWNTDLKDLTRIYRLRRGIFGTRI
jgi:chitinase